MFYLWKQGGNPWQNGLIETRFSINFLCCVRCWSTGVYRTHQRTLICSQMWCKCMMMNTLPSKFHHITRAPARSGRVRVRLSTTYATSPNNHVVLTHSYSALSTPASVTHRDNTPLFLFADHQRLTPSKSYTYKLETTFLHLAHPEHYALIFYNSKCRNQGGFRRSCQFAADVAVCEHVATMWFWWKMLRKSARQQLREVGYKKSDDFCRISFEVVDFQE